MGEIYADDLENPKSALALLGDFAFFAGEPNRELALFKAEGRSQHFIIMIPQNEAWGALLERTWGAKAKKVSRLYGLFEAGLRRGSPKGRRACFRRFLLFPL